MPRALTEANQELQNWYRGLRKEQFIFDMRNESTKSNQRLNKSVKTFKQESCDVWADRPTFIQFTKAKIKLKWYPSVHYLESLDRILFIRPISDVNDKCMVEFSFHDTSSLYYKQQSILVPREVENLYN